MNTFPFAPTPDQVDVCVTIKLRTTSYNGQPPQKSSLQLRVRVPRFKAENIPMSIDKHDDYGIAVYMNGAEAERAALRVESVLQGLLDRGDYVDPSNEEIAKAARKIREETCAPMRVCYEALAEAEGSVGSAISAVLKIGLARLA